VRLYIAGPMTGFDDFNFPAFFTAAEKLQALGYETENPADNDGPTLETSLPVALSRAGNGSFESWASYLKRDLPRVAKCDGVCVLPGWQQSRGATLEVDVAERLGMPVYTLIVDPFDLIALVPRVRMVGLSGYGRSGKDTAGRILVERHGFMRASFADKLRELALAVNPIMLNDAPDGGTERLAALLERIGYEAAKDTDLEVRGVLQRLGNGVREVIGANTWVDLALRSLPDGSQVVFTDVRYPNEADAITRAGGEIWRIERRGYGPANDHISEVALDDYPIDVLVPNDGDVDDLAVMVEHYLSRKRVRAWSA